MKVQRTIFSPADILLPPYDKADSAFEKWAVIACDQFTSEPSYWAEAEAIAEDSPSALHLVCPEAYLGTPMEAEKQGEIEETMPKMLSGFLKEYKNALLFLERTLPDGRVRRGLVGKIDLLEYDYIKGSTSRIRATEDTVLQRIPPRVQIRAKAPIELPHVMLLMHDTVGFMDAVAEGKANYTCLYDFDLMLGGGHIRAYLVEGAAQTSVLSRLAVYESARGDGIVYAVGDGNHSLAAAKAHYEKGKALYGDAAEEHPARYALVELTSLEDTALDFEPIYRVVTGCDRAAFLAALSAVTVPETGAQSVRVLTDTVDEVRCFATPTHALTVGTLQNFIDDYIVDHPGVKCDYIHDEASLCALSKAPDAVGFLFDGMKKEELFPYVEKHGTLPRKTFSMGEARSKRYYIEARCIVTR